MNKQQVLNWLIHDAAMYGSAYDQHYLDLAKGLSELSNRRTVALPPRSMPERAEQVLPLLRKHFSDNVTLISLVLSHLFPGEYVFYRVGKLENEIFDGFDFLSETVPEFVFEFDRVGRTGVERYLTLNEALLGFGHAHWPNDAALQGRCSYFLYEGLGKLFLTRSNYHRYWVMATQQQYFPSLDTLVAGGDNEWSGKKDLRAGDLVFMYCMAPRKAITGIYRAEADPRFDPWSAWDGFWVRLAKVCELEWISFATMKHDPVLSQWGPVRRNFQGTVTEAIPHAIYNQLLEFVPEPMRLRHNLLPEPVAQVGRSGEFASEAEFEEQVVAPLLRRWGFRYQQQYPCQFQFGSQEHRGRVDFLVSDGYGPLTLFEDKLRIINTIELEAATAQGRSYALMLGLPSFVVAAPEGLWFYRLSRHQATLVRAFTPDELQADDAALRTLIIQARS